MDSRYRPPDQPAAGLFIRDSVTPPPAQDEEEFEFNQHRQLERHATLLRNISSVLAPSQRIEPKQHDDDDHFHELGRSLLSGPEQQVAAPATAAVAAFGGGGGLLTSQFGAAEVDLLGPSPGTGAPATDREMEDLIGPAAQLNMRSGDFGPTLPSTHSDQDANNDQQHQTLLRHQNGDDRRAPNFECSQQCRIVASFIVLFLLIVLTAILVPLSFHGIDRHRMGFFWNRASGVETSKVYQSGLYFVGLNRQAITYPTTYQLGCFNNDDMTFPTASGQVISMELCFHYTLTSDGLAAILKAYGTTFTNRVMSVARSALKTVGSQFTVDQFVTQRDDIAVAMVTQLQQAMTAAGVSISVAPEGMIIGLVTLPDSLISRNLQVFEQTQLQVQQAYEFQAAQIRLATATNVSSLKARTTVILQTAALQANQMRRVETLRGVARLRSTVGGLIFDMSQRLQLENLTAIEELAKYTLYLSAADRNGGLTPPATHNMTVITPPDTMPVLPMLDP